MCDHIKGQAIKEAHLEPHYQEPPRQTQGAFPAQAQLFCVSSDPEDHHKTGANMCGTSYTYRIDHVILLYSYSTYKNAFNE